MKLGQLIVLGGSIFFLALTGCTHYYVVNDPTGSKTYYTTDVETMSSGAVKIKDEKTGNTVTLQSSEVKEISKSEFKEALKEEKKK